MSVAVRLMRRSLPVVGVAVLAAVLYDGWVFYARWKSARDAEQAQRADEARKARQTIDLMGGTDFRIINFYASPQAIRRGQAAQICYGVYGAKTVRMEPAVPDLRPAINDCLQVSPRQDTVYKLTAADSAGHTASASLTIKVAP